MREDRKSISTETPPAATALEELLAEIRARRMEFDRLAHIPRDIVARMKAAGCYRALVPRRLGGDERSPSDFIRLIETISAADASAGWVASFGVSAIYLSALPRDTYEALYRADPDLVYAGAVYPVQPAQAVPGGYLVNGRWSYCSGCMGADMIGVGIQVDEPNATGLPRVAVMPRDRIAIDECWDTIGLKATGSHDVVARDVVVPPEFTFYRGTASLQEDAILRFPMLAIANMALSIVSLGAARSSLDWLRNAGGLRGQASDTSAFGSRPHVQSELALAEVRYLSVRAFAYETLDEAWETVQRGDPVGRELLLRLRLAGSRVTQEGAEIARMVFSVAGTAVIRRDHPIGRNMVDTAAATTHVQQSRGLWYTAGGVMLGQEPTPGFL